MKQNPDLDWLTDAAIANNPALAGTAFSRIHVSSRRLLEPAVLDIYKNAKEGEIVSMPGQPKAVIFTNADLGKLTASKFMGY